jgi:parallel beta-helix repeat protein
MSAWSTTNENGEGHDRSRCCEWQGEMKGRIFLAILALAIGCWLALGAGQASASHVSCGDTITADTKIDSDLVNCSSNGIVIGADNITLDLNGHTIDGDNELTEDCADDEICDVGVLNDGHPGVTIEGGSVREFAAGVIAFDASHNSLRHLSVSRNLFPGVVIADSPRVKFEHNTLAANGLAGVYIFASPRVQFEHNTVAANGLHTDQAGVDLFASPHSRLAYNSISDNGDIGVLGLEADDIVIEENVVTGNPETGILLEGNRNVIRHNRVSRDAVGIGVGGAGNEITRNHVSDSRVGSEGEGGVGIEVGGDGNEVTRNHVSDSRVGSAGEGGGLGISVDAGHDNVVERNVVLRADRAGIQLSLVPEFEAPPAVNTAVRGNHLLDNGDGVFVLSTAQDTLLAGNHAVGSGDDGIDVDSSATTLIGNHAVQNGDLGIEAVVGVTDGGGNKAHGNGNPAQCTNVACA